MSTVITLITDSDEGTVLHGPFSVVLKVRITWPCFSESCAGPWWKCFRYSKASKKTRLNCIFANPLTSSMLFSNLFKLLSLRKWTPTSLACPYRLFNAMGSLPLDPYKNRHTGRNIIKRNRLDEGRTAAIIHLHLDKQMAWYIFIAPSLILRVTELPLWS